MCTQLYSFKYSYLILIMICTQLCFQVTNNNNNNMRWQRWNDQSHYKRMQQISTEGVQGETRLGRQGNPLGNVQEISIRPYKQMVYVQPAPVLENDSHKLLWDFNIQTDHLILARRPDLIIINKRKRICKIVDFAVLADHRINLKESEKKDKYLDLARELKKLWNMKVTIVPIVIGALGTITKGLLKGLENLGVSRRVETIQTTALPRTARILIQVLETWGDLLSLKLQWKTIS